MIVIDIYDKPEVSEDFTDTLCTFSKNTAEVLHAITLEDFYQMIQELKMVFSMMQAPYAEDILARIEAFKETEDDIRPLV